MRMMFLTLMKMTPTKQKESNDGILLNQMNFVIILTSKEF